MAEKNPKKRQRGSSIEIIDLENPKSKASSDSCVDLTISDSDNDDDEIVEVKTFRSITRFGVKEIAEVNDRSSSKNKKSAEENFVCEICVETKMISESFQIKGCGHSYCSECMIRYVASKVQDNVTSIGCPEMNCQGVLEPEFCKSILPPEVFDRWGKAQCEALILGDQNIFCPFKDCSAPLLNEGGGKIVQSECPHCNRLFCARCEVPWHAGLVCAEFQKLDVDERGREDILLHKTAERNSWKRCPQCKIYVARISGCSSIRCRCGIAFNYETGRPYQYQFFIPQRVATFTPDPSFPNFRMTHETADRLRRWNGNILFHKL